RRQQGDTLQLEGYVQRFPTQAELVASVFRAAGGWVAPPSREADQASNSASSGRRPESDGEAKLLSHLGRYPIKANLGTGSFGVVYKGFDEELQRDVAIKVPHRHRVVQPNHIQAFLDEARVLASLDHPHVVPVHDFGRTDDGDCFVVSKFI